MTTVKKMTVPAILKTVYMAELMKRIFFVVVFIVVFFSGLFPCLLIQMYYYLYI